jgi:hypothetical protein
MSAEINEAICPCMMPGIEVYRLLVFPDGVQVRVKGLDRIFEDAYAEGKKPDRPVANELVSRLSENNYIPSGAWSEFEAVVLKEYRKFFEASEQKKNEIGNALKGK